MRKSPSNKPFLFTIGYEGADIQSFVLTLQKAGIRRLVDVRATPLSRKKGFSKSALAEHCRNARIEYLHVPELGVPKSYREAYSGEDKRDLVLGIYEKVLLRDNAVQVDQLGSALQEKASCLMCFEKDHRMCHRDRLAKAISSSTNLGVLHLEVNHERKGKTPCCR